jgi:type VI secretion system secreted protein VgrG
VSEWAVTREVQPVKYALASYDFEKPSVDLQVRSSISRQHALAEYEVFEYGGDYVERGDGELYARMRIEEEQAKFERTQAVTNARAMAPGFLFNLGMHPRSDQNAEYVVVSAEYELRSGEHEASDTPAAEYQCRFTALNTKHPFRAERITPKPVVQGPQTALVVGPGEIHTDNYGRVKVHFYWDRKSQRDDKSSCWIRVSQNWGGKGWGGMFIPHVGQEVIVMFEGGDPDLPLITGRVYNAENMPPVELPAGKTKSIIRDHGSNHIRMEGKAGSEQINMFSPFGKTTFSIGAPNQGEGGYFSTALDWVWNIGRNAKEHIEGWRDTTVDQNYKLFVGGDTINHFKGAVQFKYDGVNAKIHGGLVSDTFIGAKHSAYLAIYVDTFAAKKFEFSKGTSYKRFSSKEDHVNYSTFKKRNTGAVTVDSDTSYTILGGAGDISQLIADSGRILIKSGSSQITVSKDGHITIVSNKHIGIQARGKIALISETGEPVKIQGSVLDIDGMVEHKNFKILK